MLDRRLRTWHRRLGTLLAPFVLVQTLSGFLFGADLYRDLWTTLDVPLSRRIEVRELTTFERVMATIHIGRGTVGYAYHIALSLGIGLLVATGLWIWLRRLKRPEYPGV